MKKNHSFKWKIHALVWRPSWLCRECLNISLKHQLLWYSCPWKVFDGKIAPPKTLEEVTPETEKYQRRQKRISPRAKINFQRLKDITEGWKLSLEVEISHFGPPSILLWIYRLEAYRSFACYGLFIHTSPDWRHILKSQGQTKKKKKYHRRWR